MRKIFITSALAALAVIGSAQVTGQIDATPSNLTIRGGIVFPLDDRLRDSSDFFGGFGLDYDFPRQLIRGSTTYASADWFFKGTSGQKGNVFPLALNQRFYGRTVSGIEQYGAPYFFVGVGLAIIDVTSAADSRLLLRGGLGVELGPNIIAEATLTLTDKTKQNVRANAIGVYIGYRF